MFLLILIPILSIYFTMVRRYPKWRLPKKCQVCWSFFNKGIWLCFFAIFLGGAAECTMAQWSSGYLEKALAIPKVWGDIFDVARFSVMLGIGRTLYAKKAKSITYVLLCVL